MTSCAIRTVFTRSVWTTSSDFTSLFGFEEQLLLHRFKLMPNKPSTFIAIHQTAGANL
jgi:hypothetical protein